MRWRWIRLVLAVLLLSAYPTGAILAGTVVDVSIFATPLFGGGIFTLNITYVTDTRMDLDWTVGPDVDKVMVRAKYGSYPTDIPDQNTAPSDGYLVYYGNGLSASDTSMDFGNTVGTLYYRAWAQKVDSTWTVTPAEGNKEGLVILLAILALIPLGLTVTMFVTRNSMLGWPSGGFWFIFAAYNYQTAVVRDITDINYALFWISSSMLLFCIIGAYGLREKDDRKVGMDEDEEEYVDEAPKGTYVTDDTVSRRGERADDDMDDGFEDRPKTRRQALHERARMRKLRANLSSPSKQVRWGEFK
jgi:hypothetical protein